MFHHIFLISECKIIEISLIKCFSAAFYFKLEHYNFSWFLFFLFISTFLFAFFLFLRFLFILFHFLNRYDSWKFKSHSLAKLFSVNGTCFQCLLFWVLFSFLLPFEGLNCDKTISGFEKLISHFTNSIKFSQIYSNLMTDDESCNL